MTVPSRQLVGVFLALPALVLAAPLLSACGEKKKEKKVRVSVVVILASETDDKVDKKLTCIAREVRKLHPKLKGFRLSKMSCKSLPVDQADKFDLVENKKVCVTVQRCADKNNRVQLKVSPPAMGGITYEAACGKFLPIVTPFKTKRGEMMILAIRVEPCPKKKGK